MIVVVSGLPRSGTSLMMKMLEAGGFPVLADQKRNADVDNPKGYYEFERVKGLPKDTGWLADAEGKAVKMVSMLLYNLPRDRNYKVIFMRRNIDEILISQKKMLERQQKPSSVGDAEMKSLFERHLADITEWLTKQAHLDVFTVSYNDIVKQAGHEAHRINAFLGGILQENAMAVAVDSNLYRNRAS